MKNLSQEVQSDCAIGQCKDFTLFYVCGFLDQILSNLKSEFIIQLSRLSFFLTFLGGGLTFKFVLRGLDHSSAFLYGVAIQKVNAFLKKYAFAINETEFCKICLLANVTNT